MGLFDQQYKEIGAYLERKHTDGMISVRSPQEKTHWPTSEMNNLVLEQDTTVELGNPDDGSISFMLWDNTSPQEPEKQIQIIGPDLPELKGKKVPFGKIILIHGEGFTEENHYDRYRMLDQVRYDLQLKGYMMRAVSQFQREWSRVSKEALSKGFSFQTLGGALIDRFLELEFVHSVKVIFITAGSQDINEMNPVSDQVARIIGAMYKMELEDEMSFDCDSCEYTDVCSEVEDLRSMRNSTMKKGETNRA